MERYPIENFKDLLLEMKNNRESEGNWTWNIIRWLISKFKTK